MTRNTPASASSVSAKPAGLRVGLRTAGVTTMTAWDILFPQAAGAKLRTAGETLGVGSAPRRPMRSRAPTSSLRR